MCLWLKIQYGAKSFASIIGNSLVRKSTAFTLLILLSIGSYAQETPFKARVISVYCVGPALCEMAKQIVKEEEVVQFKYTEFPVKIDKERIKGLSYPDVFLSFPVELTSGWSDYIYRVFRIRPDSTFAVGRDATLKILYPRNTSRFIAPIVDEVDDEVYFPFYFYPRAINFVYESLFGFLSKIVPVRENALNGVFLKESITYDLEACLARISDKYKVEFIFPSERLAVFFSHIGIRNSVIGKFNEKKLNEKLFKKSQHFIFFNVTPKEKSIIKSHQNVVGKKVSFWDLDYEKDQFKVNPGLYLNKVFSSAVEVTGFSNECQIFSE